MGAIRNRVREAWSEGRPAFGIWLALPGPATAETAVTPVVDFACIDQQHGLIDYANFLPMLRAVEGRGAAPITRVPANEPSYIGKVLDAGALGVVVPLVNNAKEAAAAVAGCRYPPQGIRSYGPIRAATVLGSREPADLSAAPLCIVMVETREGLENVDEIAGTPGVDAIYIGPADLALGLGLPPDLDKGEPEHVAAVQQIRDACLRAGIAPGIQCASGASARRYAEDGFMLITAAKDTALLSAGTAREMAAAHGLEDSGGLAYT